MLKTCKTWQFFKQNKNLKIFKNFFIDHKKSNKKVKYSIQKNSVYSLMEEKGKKKTFISCKLGR